MGKDEDFSAYVAARGRTLTRSAVLMGCTLPEAEDLVQTTLLRCYTSWDKVTAARDTDAYVYRILVNCLSTGRRRMWWGEQPSARPPEQASDDHAETAAVAESVRAVLRRMAPEHRHVLVLRYFADLSDAQIAAVLAVPVGTVKSRLSRALTRLSDDHSLADVLGDRRT